jgi:hypothetical protein
LKFLERMAEPAALSGRPRSGNVGVVLSSIFEVRSYDEGRPVRRTPYPVQAVRFGKDLTLVALGGEVVVDYVLRAKRDFNAAKEPLVVAGYSNDVTSPARWPRTSKSESSPPSAMS